jgi:hypothetical protein
MSGERPFDDDRWPDQEGFACCFLCGRKVDPRDSNRATYTPDARCCEPIPAHLTPCLEEAVKNPFRLKVIAMELIRQIGADAVRRSREAAQCAIVSPLGT